MAVTKEKRLSVVLPVNENLFKENIGLKHGARIP